ncbi:hypothetical protein JKF63_00759 [Porcisia hertigi]|uniref:Uncharacterized protein n=1 Tax=Porcisia hertigi TaxID=2761500 RepID=A0A836HZN1_9TRYP|nr:hypothetical protein JKF63_00759 [Porcisia hertigi]
MSSYSSYVGSSGYSTSAVGNHRERVTRILVVGEASVGKTLLIRRLCDHIFGDIAIERGNGAVSPLEAPQCSDHASGDNDLGPEWGPTVGIAVQALKRTTSVLENTATNSGPSMPPLYNATAASEQTLELPSLYSVGRASYSNPYVEGTQYMVNGPGGTSSALQYRGQPGAVSKNCTAQPYHRVTSRCQHRQMVSQIVEFHELGGTHGYRDVARLPLSSTHYDGVMFVYHRRSLTSILYLKEWYSWIQSVFSPGPVVPSHTGTEARTSCRSPNAMPRFMLVGTQLPGDETPAAAAGIGKAAEQTLHASSGIICDEGLLDDNLEVKLRALYSRQSRNQQSRARRVLATVLGCLAWPYHVCWCLSHPFFLLSVQYQEERGPLDGRVRWVYRLLERFMLLLYRAEQALLYVMAVILFGPHQEAVVLGHSSSKAILGDIRNDELCVAQAHVCRLDSDTSFQSSLDELLAFFDILLRDDTPDEER